MTLRLGSMCTGYGGLDLAVSAVLDVEPAWVADPDPGAAAILAHRMPDVPNLGDITTVRWEDAAHVDILAAGYPCQPFSGAGLRKGTADDRHLWPHIAAAARVLRPRIIVLENVANHLRIGFADVLADLARLGFDAEWCLASASEVGAPHQRRRLFVVAAVAQNADRAACGQRRIPAPGQAEGWRPRPDARGRDRALATHAYSDTAGYDRELSAGRHPVQQRIRDDAPRRNEAPAADTSRQGCEGPGRAQEREPATPEHRAEGVQWGAYGPAINRWARALGRPAPHPTEPGRDGAPRLNPRFVEWFMGLDEGHVTAVPGLTRNQQLHALGNGVVPQQGAAALAHLLDRTETP